jgi:adenine-specific DNA-methyltransferase
MTETRSKVRTALQAFATTTTKEAGTELFGTLGYASRKTVDLDGKPSSFLHLVDRDSKLSLKRDAKVEAWNRVDLLFQLTNDEIPILVQGNRDLISGKQDYRNSIIESFVFLTIELQGEEWSRTELAGVTREINRIFPMPALILFRHGNFVSLAVIDRRPNKKDGSRDVIEKRISIVKDINFADPHRAHVDILCDIALANVKVRGKRTPTNFRDLYDGWIEALSAQTLNKKFYGELANWFFWSTKIVEFPAAVRAREDETTEKAKREAFEAQNQIAVIRLLTRLIFVWFIKEKGLVPDALFDQVELKALLNEDPVIQRDSSTYYKAVLQNLFFATLSTEMSENRDWRTKGTGGGLDGQYLIHTVYRFRDAFRAPDKALSLFKQVPFLNGGLFECLDRQVSVRDLERNPDLKKRLVKEGKHDVIRIDGFSERPENPLKVPNKIFFAAKEKVDLNADYDTKGKTYEADGLIELFSRYKFTVEENTPVEEEVALDPELLGKVFENLLASYNTDTRITARKKSGSFYTPREVVDYMVDEALVAHFQRRLAAAPAEAPHGKPRQQALDMAMPGEFDLTRPADNPASLASDTVDLGKRLRNLLSFKESGNPFSSAETGQLIAAIDSLKALDPACGSGAFPMGLLQKLIHVLHRLDPDNARWKAQNRKPLEQSLLAAHATVNPADKEKRIEEAESALAKLDRDFSDANRPDYARKLYLIDKCLFGVDIQPIAVQIAKLRFFISLVVSQKIDPNNPDNLNITALPNLETKLVAANSLIPIERAEQADLFRNTNIAEKEAELSAMNARYFSARTAKTKRTRREDIARLRDELAQMLKSDRNLPETDAKKMAAWDPFDQNAAAPFFDPEWMFGLSQRFDLVIGNPPYVRQEAIKDQKPALEKHYGGKDKKGNPLGVYAGTADLLIYFIQRGIELLNPGGAFAFITSNNWYRAKYGTNLRSWLNRQTQLCRIIDFGDAPVFDAIAYPTIFIATRRPIPVPAPGDTETVRVMNWPAELTREDIPDFPQLVDEIGFDMPQKALAMDGWQLEPQARRGLLERIRAAGMPLGQYVEGRFYRGILTGLNDAFVIDGPTKDRLIAEHASSAAIIKPFLRGRDIKRWRLDPQDLWLVYVPWHFPLHLDKTVNGASDKAEELFRVTYPAVYAHLETYKEQLWARNKAETGIRYEWYSLQRWGAEFWEEFARPKIIVPAISDQPNAAFDSQGHYPNNKATFFVTDEPWLPLAVLNSPVSLWFAKQNFASKQGGFWDFEPRYSSTFPIPRAADALKRPVTALAKVADQATDNRLEQLLNGFVYELFFKDDLHARGLTLFDEAERAGLGRLAGLEGAELVKAATSFAATHLIPGARLRTMLSDLATLDVVRIIEGRE